MLAVAVRLYVPRAYLGPSTQGVSYLVTFHARPPGPLAQLEGTPLVGTADVELFFVVPHGY